MLVLACGFTAIFLNFKFSINRTVPAQMVSVLERPVDRTVKRKTNKIIRTVTNANFTAFRNIDILLVNIDYTLFFL